MAINGLGEFFESLFGDNHKRTNNLSDKVDNKAWEDLTKKLDDLAETAANASVIADLYRKKLKEQTDAMNALQPNTAEWQRAQKELKDTQKDFAKAAAQSDKAHKTYHEQLELTAHNTGVAADSIQNYNDAMKKSSKENVVGKKSLEGVMETVSKKFSDFSSLVKLNLYTALALATDQLIDMNKELNDLQRKSGGILSSNVIGFNEFGGNNSTVNGGGVKSTALTNGLDTSEFLDTFKAFDQGKILGGVNLKEEQANLKEYGAEIGKINKFYGVNAEATKKVATVLTNQYGKGIKDTTDIMSKAAGAAKDAGLNVGVFYENMSKVADLQGRLFVAGGAQGIVKSANALTKLGLSVQTLTKMADGYTGLNDVITKQQQASALGLQNIAAAQNKIFAQIQNGKAAEALKTAQFAAAQDITRLGYTDKNGIINTQGVQSLKAAGMDEEQIKSVQRLINEQKRIGASFESLRTGVGLTTAQLQKRAQIDEENMSIGEKFGALWGQVNATIIEPLANVLGPLLKLAIGIVTEAFKGLNIFLSPLIWLFKKVGDILGGFSAMGPVVKILGGIFALMIAWKAWAMAQGAVSGLKGIVTDIVGDKLLGKFGKFGKFMQGSKLGQLTTKIGDSNLVQKVVNSKVGQGTSKVFSRLFPKIGAGAVAGEGAMDVLSAAHFGTEGAAGAAGTAGKGLLGGAKGLLGGAGKLAGGATKLLRGGIGGMLLGWAGDLAGEKIKGDSKEGSAKSTLGTAVSWGAQGAGLGMMLGPLGAAIGGGIGALAGVVKEQWGPLTKGFDKFMEHPFKNGLEMLVNPIGTIAGLVADIANEDKKKDLDVKIGSIAAQASKLPVMDAIMQGRKMDNSRAEQSEKETMVNSTALGNRPQPVTVNITNDSHAMGGLKTKIAGH